MNTVKAKALAAEMGLVFKYLPSDFCWGAYNPKAPGAFKPLTMLSSKTVKDIDIDSFADLFLVPLLKTGSDVMNPGFYHETGVKAA